MAGADEAGGGLTIQRTMHIRRRPVLRTCPTQMQSAFGTLDSTGATLLDQRLLSARAQVARYGAIFAMRVPCRIGSRAVFLCPVMGFLRLPRVRGIADGGFRRCR